MNEVGFGWCSQQVKVEGERGQMMKEDLLKKSWGEEVDVPQQQGLVALRQEQGWQRQAF